MASGYSYGIYFLSFELLIISKIFIKEYIGNYLSIFTEG